MSSFDIISFDQDEELIVEVMKYPSLYDSNHYQYKFNEFNGMHWDSIAALLGKESDVCKERWKSIMEKYIRLSKLNSPAVASGWVLYNRLNFLDCNLQNGDNPNSAAIKALEMMEVAASGGGIGDDYCDAPDFIDIGALTNGASLPHSNSSDPATSIINLLDDDPIPPLPADPFMEDPIDEFYRNIATTVKNLPLYMQAEAKMKTLTMVAELEKQAARFK